MKKHLSLFVLVLCTLSLFAQSSDNEDGVVKIERYNQNAYREGQVIVKFRPESAVRMRRNAQGKVVSASVSKVTDMLNSLGFDEADELMPLSGNQVSPRKMRAFNGEEIQDKNLSKLYCFRASKDAHIDMHNAIEQLQSLDEVEFAEPNYIVYALASDSGTYVNEPLYSQQWGPAAIGLPALWNQPKITTKRPVIAIIDTGVDIEHPDLAANIWTNEKEANGVEGEDDDNNSFVDDIHGWDFVNQTSKMADYNGHGTHCAGIAAAVGDNGIGITGANPDALIMPIAVLQSDGTGDIATIIKGIDYATANGADVISMSLGSYSYSIALQQSLAKAYSKAVLVAAAGNDGININPISGVYGAPMYPAAFQFVFGVMASTKQADLANFSNFDYDGPILSVYNNDETLYNYELSAPGKDIISTFPNGRYRKMNGTSMACPLAAGAISRLLECKSYGNKEYLFADLIHTEHYTMAMPCYMDMMAAYNIQDKDRKPTLSIATYYLTDTLGDNDGRANAGDTLAIYPVLRNDWGYAKNIRVWMEMGDDLEDATLVTFLDPDSVKFGHNLSSYAKSRSANPIRLAISKRCVDGRHIKLKLKATCDNTDSITEQPITLEVENGIEIGGMLTKDMTLYPDVHYIVTSLLAIPAGVTLTIKPGTILKFKDHTGISTAEGGHIIAKGTADSIIVFTKTNLGQGQDVTIAAADTSVFSYCDFHSFIGDGYGEYHQGFYLYGDAVFVSNCCFYDISSNAHCIVKGNNISQCNFYNLNTMQVTDSKLLSRSNICKNSKYGLLTRLANTLLGGGAGLYHGYTNNWDETLIKDNNVFGNRSVYKDYNKNLVNCNFVSQSSTPVVIDAPQYWGSNREDIISEGI